MKEKENGTDLLYDLIDQAGQYDDSIVLGRGDPDFDTPEYIIDAARDAMEQHSTKQTPPEGIIPLRKAIAKRVKRVNDISVDPKTEVVVTNGGQEALFLMVLTTLAPDDGIIVPEPNYNTYNDALQFAHGEKIKVKTSIEEDFRVDPESVREAVTEEAKALLMVSPNNPTANVISPDDVRKMVQIAKEHELVIISDEIYDLFVYDDFDHCSPASLSEGRERTLTMNAVSKAYSMTGWRLGWIVGPADLMAQVKEIKTSITASTAIISQYAGLEALTGPQESMHEMQDAYAKRRQLVINTLDDLGLEYGVPQGGQFIFFNIGFTDISPGELSRHILEQQHVLVYPGTGFSEDQEYMRLTFLQPEEKLREGLNRIKTVMKNSVL